MRVRPGSHASSWRAHPHHLALTLRSSRLLRLLLRAGVLLCPQRRAESAPPFYTGSVTRGLAPAQLWERRAAFRPVAPGDAMGPEGSGDRARALASAGIALAPLSPPVACSWDPWEAEVLRKQLSSNPLYPKMCERMSPKSTGLALSKAARHK